MDQVDLHVVSLAVDEGTDLVDVGCPAGPLASPGGAAKLGALGVDTPLVVGLPPKAEPLTAAEGG
jgi:hypothetical protein